MILLGEFLLPLILRIGITQRIRPEGPESHHLKAGTPTMGGIAILLVMAVLGFMFLDLEGPAHLIPGVLGSFALLGALDDGIKLFRGRNEGLSIRQKFLLQIIFSSCFAFLLVQSGHEHLVSGLAWNLGLGNSVLYFLFAVFLVTASANAVNLTDGLDGLASGLLGCAFLTLAWLAPAEANDVRGLALLAAGGTLGFLWFNLHPARWFLGDVGSLSLGALLGALAIVAHQEFLLILMGGVFVVETLSVIVQVASFKLWGKRIFRMSPLHHHFELGGLSENQVVTRFWGVGLLCCLIALALG